MPTRMRPSADTGGEASGSKQPGGTKIKTKRLFYVLASATNSAGGRYMPFDLLCIETTSHIYIYIYTVTIGSDGAESTSFTTRPNIAYNPMIFIFSTVEFLRSM